MRVCSVEDCGRKHYSKSFCEMHYQRARRGGDMSKPPKTVYTEDDRCGVPLCDDPPYSKHLCYVHYKQQSKGQEFALPKRARGTKPCRVPFCESVQYSRRGLCKSHEYVSYTYRMDFETLTRLMWNAHCQVCASRDNLVVDHDHTCCPGASRTCGGCTRGILCRPCNTSLGLLQENPQRIARLAQYVEKLL